MSTMILAAKRGLSDLFDTAHALWSVRVLALVLLGLVAWASPAAGRIIVDTISEAYLQVSVFVAATLALLYGLERLFNVDSAELLARYPRSQVPLAAFLGALPGCGGAIVVVTQYVNGRLSFGALIAVLTATMGDAAFLLLAREPMTGLLVFALGLGVGSLCGWLVDGFHGRDFMRAQTQADVARRQLRLREQRRADAVRLHPLWLALMLPGVVLAVPIAAQVDPNSWFGPLAAYEPVTWLGFAGGMLALLMWSARLCGTPGDEFDAVGTLANPADREKSPGRPPITRRVISDTNFVTVWVIAAFLCYELGMYFSGADLASWFAVWAPVTPLIAVLVGFLPGCGPQIVVTTLYLTGVIPMAALLGNAISNDGDALFPALALAPRAAILATAYTGVPALIVGYAVYFLS